MTQEISAPASDTGEQTQQQESQTPPATPEAAPESGENRGAIPYARFAQVNDQKKAMEDQLEALAQEMAEDIPEQFRGIIPESLPAADRIKWMRNATKSGLFSGPSANGPDNQRPQGKPPVDYDNMSPSQMMEQGYGKS